MIKRGWILNKEINKKGQFYLVAAIMIVIVIFGLTSIRTFAIVKTEPRQINDISAELKEETTRIIDYGIFSGKNLTEISENFTNEEYAPYFIKKTENANILFIYGNLTNLYSAQYLPQSTGNVFATLGGGGTNWQESTVLVNKTTVTGIIKGDILTVTMLGKDFDFEVKGNEMFYFVVAQEREGEIYVERN